MFGSVWVMAGHVRGSRPRCGTPRTTGGLRAGTGLASIAATRVTPPASRNLPGVKLATFCTLLALLAPALAHADADSLSAAAPARPRVAAPT